MADELQQERARLASRMREQLWRYYPQMLERSVRGYPSAGESVAPGGDHGSPSQQ